MVRLTLIPIMAAASVSCATARIAFPCRVERTNHVSTRRTGITIRNTPILFHWMVIPPMVIASERGMKFGTDSKSTPTPRTSIA